MLHASDTHGSGRHRQRALLKRWEIASYEARYQDRADNKTRGLDRGFSFSKQFRCRLFQFA
jgi:hypothetical protein